MKEKKKNKCEFKVRYLCIYKYIEHSDISEGTPLFASLSRENTYPLLCVCHNMHVLRMSIYTSVLVCTCVEFKCALCIITYPSLRRAALWRTFSGGFL